MVEKVENAEDLELETDINEEEPPVENDKGEPTEVNEEEDKESEVSDDQPIDESEDDEVVVSIGEETPPQEERAPEWVRDLRKTNKELKKQNRELKNKIETQSGDGTKPVELGKKPKLEDYDYDEDNYEKNLDLWYERKIKVDEQNANHKAEKDKQAKEWQVRLDTYNELKEKLKVKDYDDAELTSQESLSATQQGIIIQGADNPALVVYALGKNPKKLKEISEIKDPVKFSWALSKLEATLKVTNRRKPPAPEQPLKGSSTSSGTSVDATLDRLRQEANKTGNSNKLMEYKRKLRRA